MRLITETVYKFEELPANVQKRVIENNRYINVDGFSWYNFIYENFVSDVKRIYGVTLDCDEISFSGFSTQGDGASFTHKFSEEEINNLLTRFNINFRHRMKNLFVNSCCAEVKRIAYSYCHEKTVRSDVYACDTGHDRIDRYFEKKAEELEKEIEKWKDHLCKELYRQLEEEYDWQTNDDSVADTIEAIDEEYYGNGDLYTRETA